VPADELSGVASDFDAEDDDEVGVVLRVDEVDDPIQHLRHGEIDIEGRMPYSSNATFLVHVTHDGASHPAIYKPMRGERPLWDFEPGLHRREVAAYLLSEHLGLHVVPPTVLRDGPLGEGSVQWFVTADHSQHYFTIHETHPELHDRLRAMALLDVLANNTDRKSGHVLLIPADGDRPASVWGIDNGLCFAADDKLRTVIWDFAGEPIPEPWLEAVGALCERVPLPVAALLADDEVDAIRRRAAWCVTHRRFPTDPTGRRYPWPLV
jgi:uncharacterized repeat protein (TIGR03843 family)